MLLGTEKYGRYAWHWGANRESSETLQKLWEWAKEVLTKGKLSKLLLGTDKYRRNAWNWAADRFSSGTLQKLLDLAKGILTKEELS